MYSGRLVIICLALLISGPLARASAMAVEREKRQIGGESALLLNLDTVLDLPLACSSRLIHCVTSSLPAYILLGLSNTPQYCAFADSILTCLTAGKTDVCDTVNIGAALDVLQAAKVKECSGF